MLGHNENDTVLPASTSLAKKCYFPIRSECGILWDNNELWDKSQNVGYSGSPEMTIFLIFSFKHPLINQRSYLRCYWGRIQQEYQSSFIHRRVPEKIVRENDFSKKKFLVYLFDI